MVRYIKGKDGLWVAQFQGKYRYAQTEDPPSKSFTGCSQARES